MGSKKKFRGMLLVDFLKIVFLFFKNIYFLIHFLKGIKLKTNSIIYEPFTNTLEAENNENEIKYGINGLFPDVFSNLQKILNFTYTIKAPPDNQWGSLKSNGTWTGMINELHQKRIDIGKLQKKLYIFF